MMTSMRVLLILLTFCVTLGLGSQQVWAGSAARYALVVGNNFGNTSLLELENLHHAEREAKRLRRHLVQYGNFSAERVVLVTGQGRDEILAAARGLIRLRRQDQERLGTVPTLFALFFTGHGLSGKLLTADDPLTGKDLANLFRDMHATLNLGFFDACYAGSLDLDALKSKGVESTPGFNPVTELPKELLNTEGTVWFASSRPNELSYEDQELGGLFTHFFIEAFTGADRDGVGITLDDMWEYARRRTLRMVAKYGRSQTPEKFVRSLKTRGPLYFSFPEQRSARLVFDPMTQGTFLLRYQYGALVEQVVKPAGRRLEVPVYHGKLSLSRLDQTRAEDRATQHFQLARGAEVRIRPRGIAQKRERIGYQDVPIRSKGQIPDLELTLRNYQPALALETGYRYSLIQSRLLGNPHLAVFGASLCYGPFSFGLQAGYGSMVQHFDSWNYRLNQWDLRGLAGYGIDLGTLRWDLELAGALSFFDLKYSSGQTRHPRGGWLGGGTRLSLPLPFQRPWLILSARVHLGMRLSQGIARDDTESHRAFDPAFEIGLSIPGIFF